MRRFLAVFLVMSHLLSMPQNLWALPQVSEVVHGEANFEVVSHHILNVAVSDQAIIEYNSFDIAANETVNFTLPDINAVALNRILGTDTSQILGNLNANGNLILVNTNGFFFGDTANVDVGGLIVSTRDISNQDFLDGNYIFGAIQDREEELARIVNEGSIRARNGGFAVLIGSSVENSGEITAPLGTVALASGDVVTVGISTDGLVSVAIDEAVSGKVYDSNGNEVADQIKNTGTLEANGGWIVLKAEAMEDVFHQAINLDGVVRADMAFERNGVIQIVSSGNFVSKGVVSADGGDIEVRGDMSLDGGSFAVGSSSIRVSGDWRDDAGAFQAQTSSVFLVDADSVSTVYGDNTFYNFGSTTPGKRINFEVGKTQTTLGDFVIQGKKGELVELRSTDAEGLQWMLNTLGAASVEFVLLGDSLNLGDLIKARPSNSLGNNINWDLDPVWDGGGGTSNWSEDANWDSGVQPGSKDTVTLDGTSTKDSNVDAGFAGTIKNLNVDSGYTGSLTLQRALIVTRNFTFADGIFNLGNQSLQVDRDFTQTGGIFNGDSATIDLNRKFELSGGTFNSTTGIMTIDDDFTHTSGGTFNANNGTVEFDGGNADIDVNTTETFNNVIFNSTGNKTVKSGDTLIINGTLTLEDGGVKDGTMEARGNVDVESEFTGDDASLAFGGTADQTFDLTGAVDKFDGNVTINKSSGTVSLASDLVLDAVSQDLTMTSGTFVLGDQKLTVFNTLTINGGTLNQGSGDVTTFSLSLNGGAFNQGSGKVEVGDIFELDGGTYNGGSGAFQIKNDTFINSGTFNGGSGDLDLVGTSFSDIFLMRGGTFNGGSGNLLIRNRFTLFGGAFNGVEGDMLVGGNMSIAEQATVVFKGNVNNEGAQYVQSGNATVNQGPGTFAVSGFFTLFGGTYNSGAGRLSVGRELGIVAGTFNGSSGEIDVTGDVVLLGGMLNAGSGKITASTDFLISDGEFNGGSGDLAVTNDLNVSGGTFTLGSGGIAIAKPINISGGDFNTGSTDRTILEEINLSGGNLTTGSGNITFNGGLDFTGGALNLGSGDVSIVGDLNFPAGTLNQNGGNFETGSRNIALLDLNLNGGTFTQGSGDMQINDDFVVDGGTFLGSSSPITVVDDLTLSGGAFTSTKGTLAIGGDFNRSSGAFNHNAGTVEFNGGIGTIDVNVFETFQNLVFDSTSTKTISSGDTLITLGALTLEDGSVDSGVLDVRGNVVVKNEFTGGNTPLQFTATADQTFDLTGAEDNFEGNVTINKSSGTVSLASNLTLDQSGQDLTLTSGNFNIGNRILTISDALTLNGGVFTQGAGDVVVNRDFVLDGGMVNAGSGNFVVLNNTDLKSGTFNGGSGLLDLTGTTFNDFFALSGATFNGGSGNLNANANFRLFQGTFNGVQGTTTVGRNMEIREFATANFKGNVNVSSFNYFQDGSAIVDQGPGTFSVANSYTLNGGTFNAGASKISVGSDMFVGAGTFNASTGDLDVGRDIKVAGGALNANSGKVTASDDFLISAGQFNGGSGDVVVTNNLDVSGGTFVIGSGGLTVGNPVNVTGGTLNTGSTDRTILEEVNVSGGNLNTGSGTTTFNTDLDVTSGAFNVGSGGAIIQGDLNLSGGSVSGGTSTVTVTQDVDITGGTFTSTQGNLGVGGNFKHTAGTFDANNGTLLLIGAGQSIVGSSTLNNVTKNISSPDTLTLPAGGTQTVLGNFNVKGAANNLLSLRSSTAGTQSNLDLQGSNDVEFLDIQDSNQTGTEVDCLVGCVDSGNVDGWIFSLPVVPPAGGENATVGQQTDNANSVFNGSPVNSPLTTLSPLPNFGQNFFSQAAAANIFQAQVNQATQASSQDGTLQLF
jgi:filamentous hemagglutinin family protein